MPSFDPTQAFYEDCADDYRNATQELQPQTFIRAFMSHLKHGESVLDVGCGYGRDARTFLEAGYDVTGIDYSHAFIAQATAEVSKGKFIQMDMRKCRLPEDTFHGIWANMSLLHLPKADARAVLQTLHRLLRAQGILALSVKEGIGESLEPDHRYKGRQKFYAYYQQQELIDLLNQSGFTIIEQISPDLRAYDNRSIIQILTGAQPKARTASLYPSGEPVS